MNKLISKNPILRFKLGKKIEKFYEGGDVFIKSYGNYVNKVTGQSYTPEQYKKYKLDKLRNAGYIDKNNKWIGSTNILPSSTKKENVIEKSYTPKNYEMEYKNFINGLSTNQKAWLTNLGVKYDNAKALQEFLNNKGFGNRGTQGLDGKWGNRSLEAWNKFASQIDFTPRVSISPELIEKDRQTIINLVLPKPVLSTIPQEGISNFTPLSTAKTYNKADIRNYIRSKGKDAYDFTGSQRKALRMVMNGQGTDEDKAIVKAMGLFKKGGLISTQNPIQKFKNRNFN